MIFLIKKNKSDLGGERTTEKQVQKIKDREKDWINFKKSDNKKEKVKKFFFNPYYYLIIIK